MNGQPPDSQMLGALRDDPGPLPQAVHAQPRVSEEVSRKIRNICFILSVTVIFNHCISFPHVWDWQGYREERLEPGYFDSFPVEVSVQQFFSGALGRITNPVFFLVSGFLFFYAWKPDVTSWKRKMRRRTFTLLLPYAVWSVVGKALNGINLYSNKMHLLFMEGNDYTVTDVAITFWNMHPPTQLWFLRDLMLMMVFAVPIILLLAKLPRAWFAALLLVAYGLTWPAVVDKNSLCFFTVGGYLGLKQFKPNYSSNSVRVGLIVLWILLAMVYSILAIATDLNLRLLFKGVVLSGVAGIWALYDFLPRRLTGVLDGLSIHRFFVYMGFDPLLPILQNSVESAVPSSELTRLSIFLLLPLVVAGICIVVAATILRLAPSAYYIISGGRLPLKVAEKEA